MIESKPLVSIIVPVYNIEKYLSRCIDSILFQTYTNFELILVDDGSSDMSGKICDEYMKKDSRISVIHQSNMGVVVARNHAINISSGDFLVFVDGDDYLEESFLMETVARAISTNSDIIWTDYFETSQIIKSIPDYEAVRSIEVTVKYLISDIIKGFLWNKLIKRSFYINSKIETDEGCTIMEDKYIMLQLLCNKPVMNYITKPLYHYSIRETSATGSLKHPFLEALPNIQHMYDYLRNNKIYEIYKEDFGRFAMKVKFTILSEYGLEKARRFMKFAHKTVSNYSLSTKMSLFYWICFNCAFLGNLLYFVYTKFKYPKIV